jgi:hypothetical protein
VLRTVYVINKKRKVPVVAVAAGLMQHIILTGFKDFPWTQLRRDYVSHYFHAALVPDVNPYGLPGVIVSGTSPPITTVRNTFVYGIHNDL